MKKDHWQDWIRRELTRDRIEPASEEFYRGVWSRIRAAKAAHTIPERARPLVSIGLACWRAVPIMSALVLLIALYGWFYPPDFGQVTTSVEPYIMDTDTAPSKSDLLYEIMHSTHVSESEAEP